MTHVDQASPAAASGIAPGDFIVAAAPPESKMLLVSTWADWGSIPVVSPLGMAGHPYVRRLFPSKENRRISERDHLGPALWVRKSVWDPETSRGLIGDWGGPETVWALLCVAAKACHKGKRRVGDG